MATPEEIREFVILRDRVLARLGLDLSLPKRGFSKDTVWLARYLLGKCYRNEMYRRDGTKRARKEWYEWLAPPTGELRFISWVDAFESLQRMPVSVVHDSIEAMWRDAYTGPHKHVGARKPDETKPYLPGHLDGTLQDLERLRCS
jgi:hypothetical protein